MRQPRNLIDVDEPGTWPTAVMDWASNWAERLRGSTGHPCDLGLPLDHEDGFRALLRGHRVLMFHCTRLLEHEATAIREHGLRRLTPELVEERLRRAHELGLISDAERDARVSGNAFAIGNTLGRGPVCLVLGREGFAEAPNGCEPLMHSWGGEGMNGGPLGDATDLTIGVPSLVVAGIDLSGSPRESRCFPSMAKLCVGRLLELRQRFADVLLMDPVPSENVLDIWQPGHPEYDRYEGLPQG